MFTWSLKTLLTNLDFLPENSHVTIPLYINQVSVLPPKIENCLINFNPIIIKSYFNKHQFQFFFSDETITESVIYTSVNHPCLLIGTSMGRIFMIPMF